MHSRTTDLLGKRFGRLLVMSFAGYLRVNSLTRERSQRAAFWVCACDCGTVLKIRACHLKVGINNPGKRSTKSCGCLAQEAMADTGKKNALEEGIAASRYVYGRYKYSAQKRGHEFALSFAEAMQLFLSHCHYCGDAPSQVAYKDWYHESFTYNGIDRVESSKGYVYDNCVSCCGRCNYAKHEGSVEDFKAWAKRLYEHINSL